MSKPNIVLVDDHAGITAIVAHALQLHFVNFNVATFSSIDEALAGIRELQPLVVITDWKFTNEGAKSATRNGGYLIRTLSAELPDTRWILFTAHPERYIVREALEAGVSGCVSKGVPSFLDLANAITQVMDGKDHFCPESSRALIALSKDVSITETEEAVLRELADGRDPKQIAQGLHVSVKTVYNTMGNLRKKLKLQTDVELAHEAVRRGLVPSPDLRPPTAL